MKPTALHPFIGMGLKTVCGIFLVSALTLTPASAFAQRGAAGHPGVARAGGVVRAPQAPVAQAPQAPVVRSPGTAVGRPTSPNPVITRPVITPPAGIIPMTSLRAPISPLRMPLPSSGIVFPSRPPRRFPITPILGTAGFRGLGYNPFWFPGCNAGFGLAYGCGFLPPYFGVGYGIGYNIGYGPTPTYPSAAYPSGPVYPSEPAYPPVESSIPLQYDPVLNQYPLESLPPEDLSATGSVSGQLPSETLLYLKDGSVFAVSSYTVSDGSLHYVTAYGEKNDVAVDLLDLQKTIEANATRGVAFTLTPPSPAPRASAPSPLGPAPAPPGPITPPKQ